MFPKDNQIALSQLRRMMPVLPSILHRLKDRPEARLAAYTPSVVLS